MLDLFGMLDPLRFFVGLHQPADAHRFGLVCLSINRLRDRKKPIPNVEIILDSGAFTELNLYGKYRHSVDVYADEIYRLHSTGVVKIAVAVAQDYMCEPFMLEKTGMTIDEHQRLTIERYDALLVAMHKRFGPTLPFPIMPVLQGFAPQDYVRHLVAYGDRLKSGMWVGVGSVCKRNGSPAQIVAVLSGIKTARPDLRLHGFGVKLTSVKNAIVRKLLHSADSMAWSFSARKQGRNSNSWLEAKAFADKVNTIARG